MKIWLKTFLLSGLLLLLFGLQPSQSLASGNAKILLDGYPLSFPVQPQVVKGTTLVPFRAIAEAMGIQVQWDNATRTIVATNPNGTAGTQLRLQINNATAYVNNQPIKLAVSPTLYKGSALIPLRVFSEQFGATVNWDGANQTVLLQSPPKDIYTMAFYAISSFSERQLIPSFDSVAFGWARINENGEFTLQGKDFYWPKSAGDVTPEGIVSEAKAGGTQPYFMVFASDRKGELMKMLQTAQLRQQTIDGILQTVRNQPFEGVALDFEGLGLSGDIELEKRLYTEFIGQLAPVLHQEGKKLSLILHPPNGSYKGYDYAQLSAMADDLIIMAYDYGQKGQPENLDKVNEAIQLALKQVPKEKLILGISMGSENAGTINSKIGLAKRYGLKGVSLWRLGLIGEPTYLEMKKAVAM
ncbi:stalk domain-containing protein [Brevibacillus laterosporus]|uniref:stalk domain-containing protein n=1 Tax=Brevibacillus laterosporus TaxID=1465 RepID=UPI00055291A4|nr:stalk domain-containing protein [Brevibacillus laterosporus]